MAEAGTARAIIETKFGEMELELLPDKARQQIRRRADDETNRLDRITLRGRKVRRNKQQNRGQNRLRTSARIYALCELRNATENGFERR